MSVMDLFWLFFIFSALQPVLRQRMLDAMRMRKIAQFERKRNFRVILLVHRQETMRLLGFPLVRYIDVNDSEQVLRAIQMTDQDVPLDLILHTPGGLVLSASQIARAIRDHKARVTVFVPHYAMSGGTFHRAGGRPDRDEQPRGARPGRPAARPKPCRLAVIVLILTGLIAVVTVAAVWSLALKVLFDLVLSHKLRCHGPGGLPGGVRHGVHGHHRARVQAIAPGPGRARRTVVQVRTVILIAMLAVVRKLIILDLAATDAPHLFALAAPILALGAVYWLVRDQDRRWRA